MDPIHDSWLKRQHADALSLCAASDVLTLDAEPGRYPPQRFIARFDCPTLVKAGAEVQRAQGYTVLFQFPPDYLRTPSDPAQIVGLLEPMNLFHPNVAPPFVCFGRMAPGTGLCELIYQVHDIMSFNKVTPREDDALNRDACAWVRRHMHLFPLTNTPLRRRAADFSVDEIGSATS